MLLKSMSSRHVSQFYALSKPKLGFYIYIYDNLHGDTGILFIIIIETCGTTVLRGCQICPVPTSWEGCFKQGRMSAEEKKNPL